MPWITFLCFFFGFHFSRQKSVFGQEVSRCQQDAFATKHLLEPLPGYTIRSGSGGFGVEFGWLTAQIRVSFGSCCLINNRFVVRSRGVRRLRLHRDVIQQKSFGEHHLGGAEATGNREHSSDIFGGDICALRRWRKSSVGLRTFRCAYMKRALGYSCQKQLCEKAFFVDWSALSLRHQPSAEKRVFRPESVIASILHTFQGSPWVKL